METSHPQALCKATSIPNRSQLKAGAKAQLRPAPLQAAQPQKAGGGNGAHLSPCPFSSLLLLFLHPNQGWVHEDESLPLFPSLLWHREGLK